MMLVVRRVAPAFFLLSSISISACSEESSSKYTTDKIEVDMHADVNNVPPGKQTRVIVGMKDGFTDIVLGDGDALTLKTDKDEKIAFKKGNLGFYEVEIPGVDRGENFVVSFTRTSGASAPNSTIKIPPAIVITGPAGSPKPTASFAAGKVELEWSNKVDGATVYFDTRTCGSASGSVGGMRPSGSDTGKFSLTMAEMGVSAAPGAGGTCISVDIERKVTNGVIDPAFKKDGSTFDGSRSDAVEVQVMP